MKNLVFLFILVVTLSQLYGNDKAIPLQAGSNKLTVTIKNTGEIPLESISISLNDVEKSTELILGNNFVNRLEADESINVPIEIFLKTMPKWEEKVIILNIASHLGLSLSKEIKITTVRKYDYLLEQNFPNPFNSQTKIKFILPEGAEKEITTLEIFNPNGEKIITLLNEKKIAGIHTIGWDGKNDIGAPVSSGIYFYRLANGNFVLTKKLQIVK
jgi:hypothetical protein